MKTLDEVIAELEDEELFADALNYLKEYREKSHQLDIGIAENRRFFEQYGEEMQRIHEIEDEYHELKDWWAEEYVTNDPLTWDELKQMEGKPVWVESSDSFNRRRWMFVGEWFDDDEMRLFDIGNDYPDYVSKNGYESGTWQAYRKERG